MNYKTIFVTTIFLLSVFAYIAPAIPAFASTGTAGLGVVNTPYLKPASTFTPAANNITVKGGSSTVVKIDGTKTSGYLAYDLSGVTFSGSQFFLYISTNGLSQICLGPNNPAGCTSADLEFAGPFSVAALSGSPQNVTNGYSIGTVSGSKLVEGPIPTNLSQGNYYIKVYDGSSTSVAVSAPFIQIVPNLVLSPTSGPAGASVKATGYGYSAGGIVNVSFSPKVDTSANVTASSTGGFSYTFTAGYLGSVASPMIYHSATTVSPANYQNLTVTAKDYTSGLSASGNYSEYYRDFAYIQSYSPANALQTVTQGPGGGTPPPYSNASSVNGYVLQKFNIAGDFWNPTQNLTFTFAGSPVTPVASSGAPNATGYFWANFTLPVASLGNHAFTVYDANTNMSIIVNIQTTFLVSPTSGVEGSSVTAQGYGFTSNANVTVWWFGTTLSSSTVNPATDNILIYSTSTGSTGSFTVTFKVPSNVYGGSHIIFANDSSKVSADAAFWVNTSFALSSNTAAQGNTVWLYFYGMWTDQSTGHYSTTDANFSVVNGQSTGTPYNEKTWYQVGYDNALVYGPYVNVEGNATGFQAVPITAAGFPGPHYVNVVGWYFYNSLTAGSQLSSTSFLLNVTGTTTEGAAIESMLQSVLNAQSTEMTTLNNILSGVGANGNAIANLSTQVSGVQSSLTTLSNSVGSLTNSVNSGFTSTQNSLSGITSTLNNVQSQTSQIPTVSGNLGNVSTYLIIAIVLAAIVLILEIIILVRKK
ncbi:MAG: hypothetical protein JRN68_05585 [Nitrososphaerota archaeon]|nr:hypothetical protein [Nitrososphaerota archaeon]